MIEFGELPLGWLIKRIEELCAFNPKHDKEISDDLEVSFVPMAAVDDVTNMIQSHEHKPLGEVKKGYTHFADGDIIFAKITPCMENGKSAVAQNLCNGLACGSTEFHVLRSYGGVLPEYLHYFLRQESYCQSAAGAMTGTVGQRRLPKEFLLNTKIPLPPLNEQRRIVAKVEALMARSQRTKEALEAIPPLLDQFRQSVLAAAFRGDLTADWREKNPDVEPASKVVENIRYKRVNQAIKPAQLQRLNEIYSYQEEEDSDLLPETWRYITLEKLCDSFQYGTSAKSMPSGQVPVLRMGNIQNGEIDWNDLVYTSDEEEIEKYKLELGNVLFNRTNSPKLVGKTGIYRGERTAIFAGYLIKVNNFDELDSEYLNYCLNTSYAKDYCWKVKTDGVSQSNINAQKLGKFEIPFCSIEEQQEIVRRVKSLLKVANRIKQQHQEAKAYLDQLDQSILAKAFRGELVPQDPNDEPASVLLERIRAERAKREAEAKVAKKSPGKTTGRGGRKAKQQELEPIQLKLPELE